MTLPWLSHCTVPQVCDVRGDASLPTHSYQQSIPSIAISVYKRGALLFCRHPATLQSPRVHLLRSSSLFLMSDMGTGQSRVAWSDGLDPDTDLARHPTSLNNLGPWQPAELPLLVEGVPTESNQYVLAPPAAGLPASADPPPEAGIPASAAPLPQDGPAALAAPAAPEANGADDVDEEMPPPTSPVASDKALGDGYPRPPTSAPAASSSTTAAHLEDPPGIQQAQPSYGIPIGLIEQIVGSIEESDEIGDTLRVEGTI